MPKEQVFAAKGSAPWFTDNNCYWMLWDDIDKIINVDESTPGQATVTCKDVTNTGFMFYGCHNLTSVDLSNFDVSNVDYMSGMFDSCENLTTLNLSNFDTSNVNSMIGMFAKCTNLVSLNLSSFDTSNVTDMAHMFNKCTNLISLDLSNFNTSKVTDMSYMFFNCSKLTSLDLSNFVTSNVKNMQSMFYNCSSLTTIKGIIDMKSCKWYEDMFYNCPKLRDVKIKNPPNNFESKCGLSKSQYTVVDDESDSLKRRNNMFDNIFKTTGVESIEPIIDVYKMPEFKHAIKIDYIPADNNNAAPKYDKAVQEFDDKKEEITKVASDFSKAVNELSNKLDEIVNKHTEKPSPKKEVVSKETKVEEEHKPTNEEKVQKAIDDKMNEEKIYTKLKNFIYESEFIPAFLWFMEHAYEKVSFAHQHKRRVYKIYKEIVKGGNLFGTCVGVNGSERGNCIFFIGGSDRAMKDFQYNRQAKAAKLLAKFIIANNTIPYVLDLISYENESDADCYTAVPTATSNIRMVYKSELYVKTLEKVCFGKDF